MNDFYFNGTISLNSDKDIFIKDFNEFLNKHDAIFKGSIRVDEFEEAEIIND